MFELVDVVSSYPRVIYLITPSDQSYVWGINYGGYEETIITVQYGSSAELPSFHLASNVRIIDNTGNICRRSIILIKKFPSCV